ncbi:MAG: PQQ-binding-like beta-propeller repeat protein [Alphaproteobacteria bacterium]|nr:PQQ-binding-like beta-propeller repeat protein [Alphaproteobacteria bacterium]
MTMQSSRINRFYSAVMVGAISAVLLSGCSDLNPFDGGEDDEILPGTRISVLALERALRPDLNAVDTQIVLPTPEDTATWSQAGGFSHHAMHHMVIGPAPSVLWRADGGASSGERNRTLGEPVVAGGRVFVLDAKSYVAAFNASNGTRLWRRELVTKDEDDGHFLGGGLAYEEGLIFATTGFAEVIALNAQSGRTVWRSKVDSPVRSAPTVSGGRVFVTTVDNQVFTLSAREGERLWTYSGVSSQTILLGGGSPAVDGGVVIAPFTNGEIAALRVDNGSVLWSDSVIAVRRTEAAASLTDIRGRPVIDRGRVYAVGHSGILVSIDLRTGQRVWDVPVPGVYQPWISGDFLYATTIDSEVVCVDVRTGQIMWVTQLRRFEDSDNQDDRIIWTGPSIASDRLIVFSSNEEALALSPYSGTVLGDIELRAPVTISPVFANSTMYVYDDDGTLLAYR